MEAISKELKLKKLQLLSNKVKLQEGLPHLHGWKFYKWAREFFESQKKEAFLCAGNQVSKSSTLIRKMIHWATAQELWPELWHTRPLQFWYLYPTRDVAQIEFSKKFVPEFLPRGEYRHDHPIYGWKPEMFHKRIWAIHFNSGVSIYFKTYAQDVQDLQTGTVWMMGLDEEPPEALMNELLMRLAATDGYLGGAFTPTLGQEYWREVIEEDGPDRRFPNSFRRQISMYDCLKYEDGTPSPWTEKKINRAKNSCKSIQDIECRVYGRFVLSDGLKYSGFHKARNVSPGHHLPKGWSFYCGVDIGSGGENHPGAIALVGVSPDFKKGRVFRGWLGDGRETTAGDIVDLTIEKTSDLNFTTIKYDWACRDFFNLAIGKGLHVEPAEKSHLVGEQILNVLFKNQMLMIYDLPELKPLVRQLGTLRVGESKNKAKDDFADALRYAVSSVPWNWDGIDDKEIIKIPKHEHGSSEDRREFWDGSGDDGLVGIEQELEGWNDLMGVECDGY